MVATTHLENNDKYDYIKFAQSWILLKSISEFLKKFGFNTDVTPIVIAGEFNSQPGDSAIHMISGKKYHLTEKSGRTLPGNCYESEYAQKNFMHIEKVIAEHHESMLNVIGQFSSVM